MSFTENDAKAKWCPHTNVPFGNGTVSGNRGFEGHPLAANCLCVASGCMAWRWSRAKETKAYLDEVQKFMAETGENFNTATNKIYAKLGSKFERTEGYCGIAGRPE